MCVLEGRGKNDIKSELSSKFWPTYKVKETYFSVDYSTLIQGHLNLFTIPHAIAI